jgi:hypothetical protein
MGYSGNLVPQYIVPTAIAVSSEPAVGANRQGVSDLDFHIGGPNQLLLAQGTIASTRRV